MSPSNASSSLKRVRMVRRSCETPASIAVRCSIAALDARFHFKECHRRAPHLARAARPEIRHLAALAETLRGIGQAQDRADLVAQEQTATMSSTSDVPTIQKRKISEFEA